jgi:hypothetical protein
MDASNAPHRRLPVKCDGAATALTVPEVELAELRQPVCGVPSSFLRLVARSC